MEAPCYNYYLHKPNEICVHNIQVHLMDEGRILIIPGVFFFYIDCSLASCFHCSISVILLSNCLILPVAKRLRFGDDIPPHAPLANPAWDQGNSVRMPQNALPSVATIPNPFRCTTTGMSIVPLEPLAQRLEAWLTLPSLSRWLRRTIRLGYAIQFARRPPKFNGLLETSVAVRNAPVLREEIDVLLAKDAIEPVPPAEMRQGFYSTYVIVPKKGGGLRPILDLRVLNRA